MDKPLNIEAIIKSSGYHYLEIPEILQRDSDIIINTLIYLGLAIITGSILSTYDIQWITEHKMCFIEALKKSGFDIRSLSAEHLNDERIICAIVKLFGRAQFQYASERIRNTSLMINIVDAQID